MSLLEFKNVLGKIETLKNGSIGAIFKYSTAIDRTKKPHAVGDTLHTTIVVSGRFKNGSLEKLEIFKLSMT